jgi:hypothetical protein
MWMTVLALSENGRIRIRCLQIFQVIVLPPLSFYGTFTRDISDMQSEAISLECSVFLLVFMIWANKCVLWILDGFGHISHHSSLQQLCLSKLFLLVSSSWVAVSLNFFLCCLTESFMSYVQFSSPLKEYALAGVVYLIWKTIRNF